MLTFKTALKATQQMGSYGELQSGALDYVSSKLVGHREDRRSLSSPQSIVPNTPPKFKRLWDEEKGAYIYLEL